MQDYYFARQAIYDQKLDVKAYELLYRSNNQNLANVVNPTAATSQLLLNTFLDMDLEQVIGKHRAFINFDQELLLSELLHQLPKQQVVIEVLEGVTPTPEIIEAVSKLHQLGFTIALDDFCYQPELQPLIELAHLIKIDILQLSEDEIISYVKQFKAQGKLLLAEKVETSEQFEFCRQLEFDYYQGYFIARPTLMKGKRPPANRLLILQLINELQQPDVSFVKMEEIVTRDVSFSYRILHTINSAAYNLPKEIESIHTALQLLGINKVKHLAILIALSQIDDKPNELIKIALVRARMAELISRQSHIATTETAFTLGLFSTLEALLDMPMQEIIEELPLAQEIKNALLHHQGALGELLLTVLNYEKGNWESLNHDPKQDRPHTLSTLYLESISWADQVTSELNVSGGQSKAVAY